MPVDAAASPWYNGFDIFHRQKVARMEKPAVAHLSLFSISRVRPAVIHVVGKAPHITPLVHAVTDPFVFGHLTLQNEPEVGFCSCHSFLWIINEAIYEQGKFSAFIKHHA